MIIRFNYKYEMEYILKTWSSLDITGSGDWCVNTLELAEEFCESDEDFKKYVETLKELNPSLADNQENLEKVALVNLQFSKASEDLQSNFEKYKQILSEDNELSVDYVKLITKKFADIYLEL